ncbi:MAG: type II toxin-antitoxin system RelE family toxin [Thermoplasmata archaeon]
MSYQLMIEERAVKELKSLPNDRQARIKNKVKEILKSDPFPGGKGDIKKIKESDFWRLRVANYKVFYDIDREEKILYILSIKHRSDAYKEI